MTAQTIPKLPAFLNTFSVTVIDPVVGPEKLRKVEAHILRLQSKTETAIKQLKVFLDTLDDVETRKMTSKEILTRSVQANTT